MRDVCADLECTITEFNGETGQVHLLVTFPPKVALSRLVNSLKGVSSRRMRQECPELAPHYAPGHRGWHYRSAPYPVFNLLRCRTHHLIPAQLWRRLLLQ